MSLKILYFLYHVLGGIYTAKSVSRKIKVCWFCGTTTLLIVPYVGLFQYLTEVDSNNNFDMHGFIMISAVAIASTIMFIVLPLITYHYREEFQVIFDYFEEQTSVASVQRDNESEIFLNKENTMREASILLLFILITYVPLTTSGLIDMLFFCSKQDSFRDMSHHLVAFPFIQRIPSMHTAVGVYILEMAFLSIIALIGLSQLNFIIIIVGEFNNALVNYCNRIVTINRSLAAGNAGANNSFQMSIASLVTEYQTFIKMVALMRPYIEIFGTSGMTFTLIQLIFGIYTFLADREEMFLKLMRICYMCLASVYFYSWCELGHKFKIMNEAVVHQVYDIPWYNLSPKQRKLVYIFLCEVQRPIEFRAYGIYPISRETFPMILKAAYGTVGVIQKTITLRR